MHSVRENIDIFIQRPLFNNGLAVTVCFLINNSATIASWENISYDHRHPAVIYF